MKKIYPFFASVIQLHTSVTALFHSVYLDSTSSMKRLKAKRLTARRIWLEMCQIRRLQSVSRCTVEPTQPGPRWPSRGVAAPSAYCPPAACLLSSGAINCADTCDVILYFSPPFTGIGASAPDKQKSECEDGEAFWEGRRNWNWWAERHKSMEEKKHRSSKTKKKKKST